MQYKSSLHLFEYDAFLALINNVHNLLKFKNELGNAVDLDDAFDKAVLIFSDNNAIASSVYGKCASCTLKIINMAFIDDRQTNGASTSLISS